MPEGFYILTAETWLTVREALRTHAPEAAELLEARSINSEHLLESVRKHLPAPVGYNQVPPADSRVWECSECQRRGYAPIQGPWHKLYCKNYRKVSP